jgi:hypothetical protein
VEPTAEATFTLTVSVPESTAIITPEATIEATAVPPAENNDPSDVPQTPNDETVEVTPDEVTPDEVTPAVEITTTQEIKDDQATPTPAAEIEDGASEATPDEEITPDETPTVVPTVAQEGEISASDEATAETDVALGGQIADIASLQATPQSEGAQEETDDTENSTPSPDKQPEAALTPTAQSQHAQLQTITATHTPLLTATVPPTANTVMTLTITSNIPARMLTAIPAVTDAPVPLLPTVTPTPKPLPTAPDEQAPAPESPLLGQPQE